MSAIATFCCLAVLSLTIFSCESKTEKRVAIEGIYLNMYTADVADPATGKLWGQRTIRDTLIITVADTADAYEVSNRRWMINTYDGKGWVTEMSGEPQSLPTYLTELDLETSSLSPLPGNSGPPLYVEGDKIHLGVAKALTYTKTD